MWDVNVKYYFNVNIGSMVDIVDMVDFVDSYARQNMTN